MSTTATPTGGKAAFDTRAFVKQYAIVGILVIFVVILAAVTGGKFMQPQNLLNVVTQVAAIGIIAIGMTFVIITLGIDLSVGSILALSAVVATSFAQIPADNAKYPNMAFAIIVPILAGLGVGLAAGFVNGWLISTFAIAPFIATLGMMSSARGLALIYSDGRPISRLDPGFNPAIAGCGLQGTANTPSSTVRSSSPPLIGFVCAAFPRGSASSLRFSFCRAINYIIRAASVQHYINLIRDGRQNIK